MKKILACALIAGMTVSLAACGSSSSSSSSTSSDAAASTEAASTEAAADTEAASGLKICIVTSSGIDDGSFNENCYDGIQAFLADHSDCTVTDVKESDLSKLVDTVDGLTGDYDVFVLPGFNFAAAGDVITANPDKYFIVVDSTITDSEGNAIAAADAGNVYTMTFSENQSAFPVGVAAALETKTGKVAAVNGMAYPSNVNYEYGFYAGVEFANKVLGTNVEYVELPSYAGTDVMGNAVGGNYIGAFDDEATGKEIGKALIDAGCDIIFVAAGTSGNGVFAAAKEADGVYCIGCDVDQFDDGAVDGRNIILTSTLKLMDTNVQKQLEAIYNGTFAAEDAFLDATNDGVGYVYAEGRQQMTEETATSVAEAFVMVQKGEMTVPGDATQNDGVDPNTQLADFIAGLQ